MTGPVNYYVDPAINANSGTGTIGDPFGDLQYALNTITRSTTVGDQINIKAGTAEIQTSAITLATYGSPTKLILRGYTTSANDGGKCEINFGSSSVKFFASSSYTNIAIIDATIVLPNGQLQFGGNATVENCVISIAGVTTGPATTVRNSKITNLTSFSGVLLSYSGCVLTGCWIESSADGHAVYQNGSVCTITGNIILAKSVTTGGIRLINNIVQANFVTHNTIISTVPSTDAAINIRSTVKNEGIVTNNLIHGFSGAGGAAIKNDAFNTRYTGTIRANRWYNCANGVTATEADVITDNSVLSESPFVDFASGDYRVKESVAGIGWPNSLAGVVGATNSVDLGALQRVASGASGFSMSSLVNFGG